MKHSNKRIERNCLNCGDTVTDRYCSHCGQENTEPRESFGHLLRHFLEDVTHYDAKFFITLRDLLFKPGFLTSEYNLGRRLRFLNPIRMYIFISAVFFLFLFSTNENEKSANPPGNVNHGVNLFKQHLADSLNQVAKAARSGQGKNEIAAGIYTSLANRLDTQMIKADTNLSFNAAINNSGEIVFAMRDPKYTSTGQFDEEQRKLPQSQRGKAVEVFFLHKMIRLTHQDGNAGEITIRHNIGHEASKIMFLLLPLFALFVGLFYSRKKFLYTQHAIFTLHFHSFLFIILLLVALISNFVSNTKPVIFMWSVVALLFYCYLVAALQKVYGQRLWLSAVKGLCISLLYAITLVITVVLLILLTFIIL